MFQGENLQSNQATTGIELQPAVANGTEVGKVLSK